MQINLGDTIRAISVALDLAHVNALPDINMIENASNIDFSKNNFMYHSLVTTYIVLEMSKILNIKNNNLKKLYYASLIHDIGGICSVNLCHSSDTFVKYHCLEGSIIIKGFPVYEDLSHIILYHHESWNGSGPFKLVGDNIPIESQIIRISDLVAILFDHEQPIYNQIDNILSWIKYNSNKLFSEKIANAFLAAASKDLFWFNMYNIGSMPFILDEIAPKVDDVLDINEFECIAEIFANIIDKKSAFTATHSRGIAELAYKVSIHIGYAEEKCRKMRIAGLLHDIGKVAIPSNILDKNDSLNEEEFSIIKSHVYYTKIILERIKDIPDICLWASNHHEKLNGKGYVKGLKAEDLSEESRILGVCDIYQALIEDRPYRSGLSQERAFSIIDGMIHENFICPKAVNYLKETLKFRL